MKSAIFQESRGPESRALRKPVLKKRGRSQSPFIAATSNNVNWNLEEVVTSYVSSGVLPGLLSPTLPPRFEGIKSERPDDSDADIRGGHESMNDSDLETLPMFLLSPTLPNMFNEGAFSKIAQPIPKKANELKMVLDSRQKTKFVRWVDKSGSEKPRFLLRINLDSSSERYKNAFINRRAATSPSKLPMKPSQKFGKTNSSTSLQGLAIFESRKARDAEESQTKPETKRTSPKKGAASKQESAHAATPIKSISEDQNKNPWVKSARELKIRQESMSSRDPLFSLVLHVDYILCLSLFCDFEDRRNIAKNMSPKEGNWHNLLGEIVQFSGRLEKLIKTNQVSDKKKGFFSFIVAILAMQKVTILRRVIQNLERSIKSHSITKDSPSETQLRVIELQRQIIKNHEKKDEFCKEAQSFFAKSPPTSTVFPKSWSRRVPGSSSASGQIISPNTDTYYLPLGPYSELRETCAFLYSCVREFAEFYAHDINGGARYTFCSSQNVSAG